MQSFQLHESPLQRDFLIAPETIKLDSTRLPLVPQPSSSEMDPLNYPNVKSTYSLTFTVLIDLRPK